MAWNIELTDEYIEWWNTLTEDEQADLASSIDLLEEKGPQLGRPYADTVQSSRHSNMKELRTQSGGRPLRSFFAFDPRRTAILLIGGDKTGNNRFYESMIPIADDLYEVYLQEIEREGLI